MSQFPTSPPLSGPHALQDYQTQLMLLEQQSKKRQMLARQAADQSAVSPPAPLQPYNPAPVPLVPAVPGVPPPGMRAPQPPMGGPPPPFVHPAATPSSIPDTHYTISEDEVGRGQASNLSAIKAKSDLPGLPAPVNYGPAPTPPIQPFGYGAPQDYSFSCQSQPPNQAVLAQRQQMQQQQQLQKQLQLQQLRQAQQAQQVQKAQQAQQSQQLQAAQMYAAQQAQTQAQAQAQARAQAQQYTPQMVPPGLILASSSSATPGIPVAHGYDDADTSSPLGPHGLQSMLEYIRSLESQLGIEKAVLDLGGPPPINVQVFHCLGGADGSLTSYYLAEPEWNIRDEEIMLKGSFPVHDPDGYIQKKRNIAFAVYRHYTVDHQRSKVEEAMKANEPLPDPDPVTMSFSLISREMVEAAKAFIALHPGFRSEFPEVNVDAGTKISSPFIWWYHYRESHKIQDLPPRQAELMTTLRHWIEENYGAVYNKTEEQFSSGRMSSKSIEYLIRPEHVLVVKDDDSLPLGYVATSRPQLVGCQERDPQEHGKPKYQWNFAVRARRYRYDGELYRRDEVLNLKFETETEDGEVDIVDLDVVPLRYAGEQMKERLERRGQTFWKCQTKRLVSCDRSSRSKDKVHAGQRFMIDFETYAKLHPGNPYVLSSTRAPRHMFQGSSTETDPKLPADGSEPKVPEIYLFPTRLPGFDLRRKKWVDLEVDQIRDVVWNDQAFHNLVADEDMKELVLALVTNQLATESATDLIDNKGNGLIMLLHGSPGTGKTFTAESVAEIAKKPLYSVTCGDIGTEPEDVEKYLASVFHLGKIWDCVVLLDEAEVFLEQRTLQDLKRNALVSVFLRALEYYEGILILTTNRVGSFDEAFKSRIQLALRYERLREDQRKQIWQNFLNRLRNLGEDENIDFDDVMQHLDELASYPMNGREIRNSITTGRQLAKFMKEKMMHSHLKRAIGVAEKFDKYLAEVREADVEETGGRGVDGRYSDDFFARQEQLR
jgi:AAA+ superfamily predicted ATPase